MTRVELGLAAYNALIALAGYGVMHGLGAARWRPPELRLLPLAYLVGFAALGSVLSIGLLAGVDPSIPHVFIATGALCAIGVLSARRLPRFELLRSRARPRRRRWAVRAPASVSPARAVFASGAMLLAAIAAALVLQRNGLSLWYLIAIGAALAGLAAGVVRIRGDELRSRGTEGVAALSAGLAMVVLATAAVADLIVAVQGEWPSEWDAWGFWVPRAETIYYWHGLYTGVGGWGAISHPEYPPLLAVMYAGCWHFAGGFHPSLLPFQQTLLAIGFGGGVLALLDRHVPRWLSFPCLALLVVTPGFVAGTHTLLADPSLGYMVAAASVSCVLWLVTDATRWLAFAVLFLGAAVLTKAEGLSLGLLLIFVILAAGFASQRRRTAPGLLLLLGPLLVEPWRLWLARHHLPTSSTDYDAGELFHPVYLAHRLGRLTYALDYLFHSVLRTGQWLVVIPVGLAAVVLAARRAPTAAAAVLAWLGLGTLGLAAVYWIGRPDLVWYVHVSADRVAGTVVLVTGTLAPLLAALALGRAPAGSSPAGRLDPPTARAAPER